MAVNKYTDRLSNSRLQSELVTKIRESEPDKMRLNLFRYVFRYNDVYDFSQLENTFLLMSKLLEDGISLTGEEKSIVQEEIELGMEEYFISLNHISEALFIIFNNLVLSLEEVGQIINHVWEAYACNENEFIDRESEYLSKNL